MMLTKTISEHLKDLLDKPACALWFERKTSEFVISLEGQLFRGHSLTEAIERALYHS